MSEGFRLGGIENIFLGSLILTVMATAGSMVSYQITGRMPYSLGDSGFLTFFGTWILLFFGLTIVELILERKKKTPLHKSEDKGK